MEKYSKLWTQFETQSLAFGMLRKALYPSYLVRGDFGTIYIYKPTADTTKPIKLLTIHVHASTTPGEAGFFNVGEHTFNLVGGMQAKNVVDYVLPELHARVAQPSVSVPSPV